MKLLEHTRDFRKVEVASVVTIGVFDGVHRGHEAIIRECVEDAKRRGVPSVALTFERNPRELVCGETPCIITAPARKIEILESLGLDYTISVNFSRNFASMGPSEFCEKVLSGHLGARQVCVGENFHFGHGGAGDVVTLASEGARFGFGVTVVPLVRIELGQLSSTLIRGLIVEGRVHEVLVGLGRPYTVSGKVVAGHSRGKRLGFPTANLMLERDFCVPPDGVYAGKAVLADGKWSCAINIGSNPTFGDAEAALEVFLIDFDGDIYGEGLEIEFHYRLREEKAFEGEEQLVGQMKKDVRKAKSLMSHGDGRQGTGG
ncbi:MAG: bifunctional riboflavin kinase/FAD synthetase [Candidatus Geothermincolia bacterium]